MSSSLVTVTLSFLAAFSLCHGGLRGLQAASGYGSRVESESASGYGEAYFSTTPSVEYGQSHMDGAMGSSRQLQAEVVTTTGSPYASGYGAAESEDLAGYGGVDAVTTHAPDSAAYMNRVVGSSRQLQLELVTTTGSPYASGYGAAESEDLAGYGGVDAVTTHAPDSAAYMNRVGSSRQLQLELVTTAGSPYASGYGAGESEDLSGYGAEEYASTTPSPTAP